MAFNQILDTFAGDRGVFAAEEELDKHTVSHNGETIYRGLPYLTENIKVGEIVSEWYGSTHWSLKKEHSEKYTTDYISDGLLEELTKERNIECDEAEKLFSPLLMKIENTHIPVVELYKYVSETFQGEMEITIRGYDFKIVNVIKKNGCFFADVEPIKKAC